MKAGFGFFLIGLILSISLGCKHNKHAKRTVTTRAAFDLRCPPEELELTVLDTEGARKLSTQIGVEGCGKRSVYIYEVSTDTWIANTAATSEIQLPSETPQEPAQPQEDPNGSDDAPNAEPPPVLEQSEVGR